MTFLKSCKLHCQNETWWVEQRICFLPPSAIERNHHIHQQIKQVWCSKLSACKLMPLNKCSPEKKTRNSLRSRAIRLKCWASQVAQWLPANAEEAKVAGLIPGAGRPLEEGTATHSSILAWRIPWTEEPGGLQSRGSQRVGHDLATKHAHTLRYKTSKWLSFLQRNSADKATFKAGGWESWAPRSHLEVTLSPGFPSCTKVS